MDRSILPITCNNRVGRILLLGMEEIIGPQNLCVLLKRDSFPESVSIERPLSQETGIPIEDLSQLQSCLEHTYGQAAGRGLAVRSGRASFKFVLHEFGQELGLTGKEFRLLPLAGRLSTGTELLAKLITQYTPQTVEQKIEGDFILWNIEHHLDCGDLQNDSPACQFTIGILQEALYWFSGGKTFQVDEMLCVCHGSPFCSIRIRKKPIQ